jgi:transposase-like protein
LAAVGQRKTAIEIRALAEQRWSTQEARVVLLAQERSGLSIHAFAREHGLSHERLYRWQRKLLGPSSEHGSTAEFADVEFAPVVVTNGRAPAAVTVRVDGVELEVADPGVVDPSWLAAVVSLVRMR